jgi:hypothetical protein
MGNKISKKFVLKNEGGLFIDEFLSAYNERRSRNKKTE